MARLPDDKERKEKIAKLPEWVRFYIAKLESDVASVQGQLNVIQEGTSRVSWSAHLGQPDVFLPEYITLNIKLNGVTIHIHPEDNFSRIQVRSDHGGIHIQPEAHNAFTMRMDEDDVRPRKA